MIYRLGIMRRVIAERVVATDTDGFERCCLILLIPPIVVKEKERDAIAPRAIRNFIDQLDEIAHSKRWRRAHSSKNISRGRSSPSAIKTCSKNFGVCNTRITCRGALGGVGVAGRTTISIWGRWRLLRARTGSCGSRTKRKRFGIPAELHFDTAISFGYPHPISAARQEERRPTKW